MRGTTPLCDRSDPRATVADQEYRSSGGYDRGHNRPSGGYDRGHSRQCFRRFYAHAWGKCLTCPELEYKCCGELWSATRTRAAGHLRRGAIVGSLRSCLIAIRFWILWFMRVLPGGGTDHGCTAPQVRVACQRSGCTLASAAMSVWARGHDHHAPPSKEMYR